jgi:hypothetical protein
LDNPPGPHQGVTLERRFRGRTYERRVRPQDYVTQIEAAAILGTTLITVNRYVRGKRLPAVKRAGISMIQLRTLLRFRRERQQGR